MSTESPLAEIQEHRADNAESLAEDLAASLAKSLRRAVGARGGATLAVSGGSTPLPLFRRLRDQDVPWSKTMVTLVDERWVDEDHPDSNAAFVRRELLTGRASAAHFLKLKNKAPTPEEGEAACERALTTPMWPLDAIILGMGSDGHTASLFPATDRNRELLARGLDLDTESRCVPMHPGEAPHPRMSLTLKALLDARRVILHITGKKKRQVYEQALQPGPAEELPIRAVLHQKRRPVEVYWAP